MNELGSLEEHNNRQLKHIFSLYPHNNSMRRYYHHLFIGKEAKVRGSKFTCPGHTGQFFQEKGSLR